MFSASIGAISYFTRFDRERLNRTIRFLARIRKAIPSLYASLRDSTARRKAAAEKPATEPIVLSAVAINVASDPVAWRSLELASDYGATAAVAVGTALAASGGQLPPCAGMLAQVTDLAAVLSYDTLQDVIIARDAHDSFNATGQ